MLKITPSVIDQVRKELETSFDKIEKKFGIKLDTGSARYNASEFHLKITGIVITKENAGLSAEEVSLKKDLELYGEHIFSMGAKLLPEDYGKTFEASHRKWTFIGINPKKHKYPIAAKNSDGKIYYFTEHYALKIRPLKPIVNFARKGRKENDMQKLNFYEDDTKIRLVNKSGVIVCEGTVRHCTNYILKEKLSMDTQSSIRGVLGKVRDQKNRSAYKLKVLSV